MLGEVYLASALAIFFAIYGWSEKIFGLSEKTKEIESAFMRKTKLTFSKYSELRKIISQSKIEHPGVHIKKIMGLLKGTKLKPQDKFIFNKLKENNDTIKKMSKYVIAKKIFFGVLFFYLFIVGTILIIMEKINLEDPNINLFIILQAILLVLILLGMFIYIKISGDESSIQKNLNESILRSE